MLKAADKPIIKIETDCTSLIFQVGDNGRLYQRYLGKKLNHESDFVYLPQGTEVYITHGAEDYFEPAIQVLHNDGNPSLLLKYVEHSSSRQNDGSVETVITLKDDKYPVTVKLHYITYAAENIIKTFTEINHQEKKTSADKHGIPKTKKPVPFLYCHFICMHDFFFPCQRRYQHQ